MGLLHPPLTHPRVYIATVEAKIRFCISGFLAPGVVRSSPPPYSTLPSPTLGFILLQWKRKSGFAYQVFWLQAWSALRLLPTPPSPYPPQGLYCYSGSENQVLHIRFSGSRRGPLFASSLLHPPLTHPRVYIATVEAKIRFCISGFLAPGVVRSSPPPYSTLPSPTPGFILLQWKRKSGFAYQVFWLQAWSALRLLPTPPSPHPPQGLYCYSGSENQVLHIRFSGSRRGPLFASSLLHPPLTHPRVLYCYSGSENQVLHIRFSGSRRGPLFASSLLHPPLTHPRVYIATVEAKIRFCISGFLAPGCENPENHGGARAGERFKRSRGLKNTVAPERAGAPSALGVRKPRWRPSG